MIRYFGYAFSSLIERPMRTGLTMLGIIIGVAAVYAMLAIGNGTREKILEQMDGVSARSITLYPDWSRGRSSSRRPWRPFIEADVDAMRSIYGTQYVTGELSSEYSVVNSATDWRADIRGTDADYIASNDIQLKLGRNLTEDDLSTRATVAVLGESAAKALFRNAYPIGEEIKIQRVPFTIIGVLDTYDPSWTRSNDPNNFILIPRSTMRARLAGDHHLARNQVQSIRLIGLNQEVLTSIETELDLILRRSRNLSPADAPDFRVFNFSANRQQYADSQRALSILLATMGIVSLIVGGVGVMNIMLVNVTERTREIGLRMSVGARRVDILMQFLTEATLLCIIAGLLGLALGFSVSYFSPANDELEMVFSWPIAGLSFGSALLVGLIFGFLPARRASLLSPVEALRDA